MSNYEKTGFADLIHRARMLLLNSDLEYYLADCAEEVEVWPGHVDIIRWASAARRCRLAATSAVTVARSLS
jgi:hypothetical protein